MLLYLNTITIDFIDLSGSLLFRHSLLIYHILEMVRIWLFMPEFFCTGCLKSEASVLTFRLCSHKMLAAVVLFSGIFPNWTMTSAMITIVDLVSVLSVQIILITLVTLELIFQLFVYFFYNDFCGLVFFHGLSVVGYFLWLQPSYSEHEILFGGYVHFNAILSVCCLAEDDLLFLRHFGDFRSFLLLSHFYKWNFPSFTSWISFLPLWSLFCLLNLLTALHLLSSGCFILLHFSATINSFLPH